MAVEDECHCSDSSEPSNLTSLYTDMSSIINCTEKLDKNVASLNENECLCRSVQCPPPDNQLSRPVRQVSPQRYQLDRPQLPVAQPIPPSEERPTSCHCPYANVHAVSKRDQDTSEATRPLRERFNFKWSKKEESQKRKDEEDKTYQVKVKKNLYQNYPKSYVCCEISEGIPKRKNSRDPEKQETGVTTTPHPDVEDKSEKIEIYYFDHGNSAYYRTTDAPPILATEKCAERTDYIATRFWAEIFGTIHIGMAFVTAFILQLIRFILFSIIRPLTVGIVQLTADYMLKPSLSILFNGLIQPFLILFYNVATSFRDLCEPLAEGLGFFFKQIAQLFRAFRIVDVNNCQAKNNST